MQNMNAKNLVDAALSASSLDGISARAFIRTIIDVAPALADEFRNVRIRIDSRNAGEFCAVLRRGIAARGRAASGQPGVDLARRIEIHAMFHSGVELSLPADLARVLVRNLEAGMAATSEEAGSSA